MCEENKQTFLMKKRSRSFSFLSEWGGDVGYWNSNFPINAHVCLLVDWYIGRLVYLSLFLAMKGKLYFQCSFFSLFRFVNLFVEVLWKIYGNCVIFLFICLFFYQFRRPSVCPSVRYNSLLTELSSSHFF